MANHSTSSQSQFRGRGMGDSYNSNTPYSTYSGGIPPSPPLVFSAQLGGIPLQQQDPFLTSPYIEHLQVNYQAVLGRHNSRTLIEVEDSPIKVTCHTKGAAHSPYMAPLLGDTTTEGDRSGRHNPYAYSCSGTCSPMQLSTPTHSQQPQNFDGKFQGTMLCGLPYDPRGNRMEDTSLTVGHSARLDSAFELPPEVVHRSLKDRCRYIQFPQNLPAFSKPGTPGTNMNVGNIPNNSLVKSSPSEASLPIALFIGQVRFETTPAELLWLVHRTCGACASHLESRGAGCYLLYCKSEADLTLVRSLHKRVLFDVGGVWLARTADEVDAMCEYISLDAPLLSKKARLPRDSMVVEELKADAVGNGGRRGRGGGNCRDMQHDGSQHYMGAVGGQRTEGDTRGLPTAPQNTRLYSGGATQGGNGRPQQRLNNQAPKEEQGLSMGRLSPPPYEGMIP